VDILAKIYKYSGNLLFLTVLDKLLILFM